MSAIPEEFINKTNKLSAEITRPITGSQKIYVQGSRPDIRVAMREVQLTDTPASFGKQRNAPVTLYDTSGPYTDANVEIDLLKGLPALRDRWIRDRGDSEQLDGPSSAFGRQRQKDPVLARLRFEQRDRRVALFAEAGGGVG